MATSIKVKRSAVAGRVPATTDLALGEIAINTYDGVAYIKKSVSGTETVVPVGLVDLTQGLQTRYSYTATASQTTFSAQYVDPYVDVYLNGIRLVQGTDYTATTGTNIVLATGASANDIVEIVGYTNYTANSDFSNLTSTNVTTALGFTPYDASNPNSYITGITSGDVTTALGYTPESTANKGQANGYASLDSSGLVPSSQLPSYVDDVVEYTNLAGFPGTGISGKIYVALDTNKTYRWSGSAYVEISASPGTTDSVTEGSINLYYTDTRARGAISVAQNLTYNNSTGVITGPNLSGYLTSSTAATTYQPLDGDLTSIAGLSGTSGLLKKTSANTWALDTNTYITGITSSDVTTALGFTPYNATNPSGYTTNTGTVTSVSGTGTVSGLTLTGSITTSGSLTLGGTLSVANSATTATALNTPSAIVARDGSGNFAAGTITATLTGNADTATKLATPRAINGVNFDGSAAITVTAAAGTLTGTTLNSTVVNSSLTSVGTIATGVWNGTAITDTYLGTISTTGKVSNSATTATSANTASAIVARDSSGNFTAGTITATLSGNATNISAYTINQNLGTTNSPTFNGLSLTSLTAGGTTGTNGQVLQSTGTGLQWASVSAGSGGTVTSVGMTVPTGLSVAGSPITGSGTLAVTFAAGYSIPTTTNQSNWSTAYGWGDHSVAGYLTSSTAASTYQPLDGDLTSIAALAGTSGLLKKTAANTWALDTSTYLTAESDTLSSVTGRGATTATAISITNSTASSSTGTGALIVTGGVGVGGNANIGGDLVVTGNLTINGTTTTINSTVTTVDDIAIELGSVASPTDTTAAGGGMILKGATDKSITWGATNGWTSTETFNIATGKTYKIAGTDVLSGNTLGSGITASSLTSVGTITSGTWSGSFGAVSGANLTNLTAGNLTGTISSTVLGNSTAYIGTTAVALNRASANLALTGITSIAFGSDTVVGTASATVATTTQTAVDSWAIATYRSAKYLVQVTQGSNYQVSEIMVIHNGTTTTMAEYGVVETNGSLATFATDISAGNARLLVTMGSATSATIKVERVSVTV